MSQVAHWGEDDTKRENNTPSVSPLCDSSVRGDSSRIRLKKLSFARPMPIPHWGATERDDHNVTTPRGLRRPEECDGQGSGKLLGFTDTGYRGPHFLTFSGAKCRCGVEKRWECSETQGDKGALMENGESGTFSRNDADAEPSMPTRLKQSYQGGSEASTGPCSFPLSQSRQTLLGATGPGTSAHSDLSSDASLLYFDRVVCTAQERRRRRRLSLEMPIDISSIQAEDPSTRLVESNFCSAPSRTLPHSAGHALSGAREQREGEARGEDEGERAEWSPLSLRADGTPLRTGHRSHGSLTPSSRKQEADAVRGGLSVNARIPALHFSSSRHSEGETSLSSNAMAGATLLQHRHPDPLHLLSRSGVTHSAVDARSEQEHQEGAVPYRRRAVGRFISSPPVHDDADSPASDCLGARCTHVHYHYHLQVSQGERADRSGETLPEERSSATRETSLETGLLTPPRVHVLSHCHILSAQKRLCCMESAKRASLVADWIMGLTRMAQSFATPSATMGPEDTRSQPGCGAVVGSDVEEGEVLATRSESTNSFVGVSSREKTAPPEETSLPRADGDAAVDLDAVSERPPHMMGPAPACSTSLVRGVSATTLQFYSSTSFFSRLLFADVDALLRLHPRSDCPYPIQEGDRVSSIEGKVVLHLHEVVAWESQVDWDLCDEQYLTLIREGMRLFTTTNISEEAGNESPRTPRESSRTTDNPIRRLRSLDRRRYAVRLKVIAPYHHLVPVCTGTVEACEGD